MMRQRSIAAKIGIVDRDLRRVPTYNTMDRSTTFADEDRKSLNDENEISVSRFYAFSLSRGERNGQNRVISKTGRHLKIYDFVGLALEGT